MNKRAVFGTHDEKTLAQLRDVATRAERVALMADGHLGYVMPIGGVAAYRDSVSVVGVGFDIACGNAAIHTDRGVDESPHAYRRLPDVLAAQGDTVTVLHTLTPVIVVMAGEKEFDPYKD